MLPYGLGQKVEFQKNFGPRNPGQKTLDTKALDTQKLWTKNSSQKIGIKEKL